MSDTKAALRASLRAIFRPPNTECPAPFAAVVQANGTGLFIKRWRNDRYFFFSSVPLEKRPKKTNTHYIKDWFMAGADYIVHGEKKDFVGIGKMMIDFINPEWNIPHLHFIINKTASGLFEATNIELILDAIGETIEDTIESLSGLTIHYISEVMSKGRGYEEFIEKINSSAMEDFWRAYRNVEFNLAKRRKDLSHELSSKINSAIKNMIAEEVKQQIKQFANEIADVIITNFNVEIATLELGAA